MGPAILKVPFPARTLSPLPEASGLMPCPLLPPSPGGPTPAFLVVFFFPQAAWETAVILVR